MRSMIQALDHPTFVALEFFMHFLVETQCPAFILNKYVSDRMPGSKIVVSLMRFPFLLGIAQMAWQRQT